MMVTDLCWRFSQHYESASNISNCRQQCWPNTDDNPQYANSMWRGRQISQYNGLESIYRQILSIDAPAIARQWWSTTVNQESRSYAIQLGNRRIIVWQIVIHQKTAKIELDFVYRCPYYGLHRLNLYGVEKIQNFMVSSKRTCPKLQKCCHVS